VRKSSVPVEKVVSIIDHEQLPVGWEIPTIGDICSKVHKVNPKDDPASEFSYIDISGIDNEHFRIANTKRYAGADAPSRARQLVKKGDVVFSTVRTYLKNFALVTAELDGQIASTGFCVLRAGSTELSKYLFYYVQYEKFLNELAKFQRGTSYPAVRASDVFAQHIPVPPKGHAGLIVAEIEKQFSRLDEAVANLKRVKANLKRYKAAVLKAAVEGKLTEEWRKQHPDVEPADKLLERILSERREKWQGRGKYKEPAAPDTTDLPELPEGWVWVSPEQVSSREQYSLAIGPFGSNLKVGDYQETGVPLVFVRNIRANYFGPEKAVFISEEKAEELKAHQISGGDLLITKMGDPPGDVCVYPKELSRAVITADCIKLRLSPLLDAAAYFHRTIESRIVQKQILDVTKGVAQLKVSLARFKTIALPVPSLDEQRKISEEIERYFSIIAGSETQIESNLLLADRLRQAILKQAFIGKLVAT